MVVLPDTIVGVFWDRPYVVRGVVVLGSKGGGYSTVDGGARSVGDSILSDGVSCTKFAVYPLPSDL